MLTDQHQLLHEAANLEAPNSNTFVIEHGGDHVATRFCLLRREGQGRSLRGLMAAVTKTEVLIPETVADELLAARTAQRPIVCPRYWLSPARIALLSMVVSL